jgi:hypothetical protein
VVARIPCLFRPPFYWEGAGQRPGFLVFAVVGGAIAVPVIGFLTALGGSGMQALIRWRREKRLPQAA